MEPIRVKSNNKREVAIHVTRPKSQLDKKSNCYNGAIIWNNLPVYIRSLKEKATAKD